MAHYTDELDLYLTSRANVLVFYENNVLPETPFIEQLWEHSYSQIYALNDIIAYTTDNDKLSEAFAIQIQGEAYFLRALLHLYLQQLFGEIPYVTGTNYVENTNIAKSSEEAVFEKLIQDLKMAKNLLPEAYPSSERVRPNQAVATALLARVYLYSGDWDQAIAQASQVIENPLYKVDLPLSEVFLKNSQAVLLQFSPGAEGANTYEAANYVFESLPPPRTALTSKLISSFEVQDQRLQQWIGKVGEGEAARYFPHKYQENRNTARTLEYSILLRIGEQYLIRSEAQARLGQLEAAAIDLNAIRTRADLPDLEPTTQEQLLAAILQERRHELFTEYGHRFFDLKRFDAADATLSYKSGWEPYKIKLPLPDAELVLNPNLLPQNPGY
nr:RagB/SusD family nutrient uptake outer membrane protein [Leeuwenhoekiella parthenopeia]